MRSVNPLVIPRNHKVESFLDKANKNDIEPLNEFLAILKPYSEQKDIPDYQVPSSSNKNIKLIVNLVKEHMALVWPFYLKLSNRHI